MDKKPEEIELSDFINMLKISAETDNEKARRDIYMLTDLLEKDEINFWKLSPHDIMDLLQYAGYTEVDDMVKAFKSIHSREKFDKFMEERRKNSFLGRLKSTIGGIINPKKAEPTQEEQSKAEEQQVATEEQGQQANSTNDSNDGEER